MANPAFCYLVHVNPTSATAFDGVSVHNPDGSPFPGARVKSGELLCFTPDPRPGTSTVSNFQVVKGTCGSCQVVNPPGGFPNSLYISFSPSIGSPDTLLLNAVAGANTYSAARNGDTILGGRPIIRNTFDHLLVVGLVATAVALLGALLWRYFFRPDPPPTGLGNRNDASDRT